MKHLLMEKFDSELKIVSKKCKDGPNIMINGKFYHHMNADKTKEVLKKIK